jgi:hypothetical protein
MERNTDVKEAIDTLGEDLRERASRTVEPIKREFKQFWESAVSLMKKHPGTTLGLAAVGGAVTGILVARLAAPKRSDAEKSVHHWVNKAHNVQESWAQLRDGLDHALTSVRSAISLLK